MSTLDAVLQGIFVDQTRVVLILGCILLVMAEVGYRMGLRLHRLRDEARMKQIGGVQGAVLGLLGLLVGFTFAMAVQRYENRRSLVLEEANAIGTATLRASFLPLEAQRESRALYRRYVEWRLHLVEAAATPAGLAAHEEEAARIQGRLWKIAEVAATANPNALMSVYVQSLNEVIDVDAKRVAASRNHIPGAVWLLLIVVASAGCWSTGYSSGSSGRRSVFSQVSLPLLITVVIGLVADLDRPRHGLIGVDQRSLRDLQVSLEEGTAPR